MHTTKSAKSTISYLEVYFKSCSRSIKIFDFGIVPKVWYFVFFIWVSKQTIRKSKYNHPGEWLHTVQHYMLWKIWIHPSCLRDLCFSCFVVFCCCFCFILILYVLCFFPFCLPPFCVLCPMLTVSLYCLFLIVPSLFSYK